MSPKAVLQAFFEAFGAGDKARAVSLFAEDAVIKVEGAEHVPFVGERHGRDEVAEFLEVLTSVAEPELFEVHDILEQSGQAVAFGTFRFLVPSTGRRYGGDFALRVTVEGAHIQRYQIYENSYSVAEAYDRAGDYERS